MTVQQAFDNFIFSRRIQGLTEKSIDCYVSFNKPFIAQIGSDTDISLINRDLVNTYIDNLFKRQISRSTVATYVRHVKIFLKWIENEYEVILQAEKIKIPKTPKKVLHIYSDDEIRLIFDTVKGEPWIVARNCCIIALMLDAGLRQCEVCNLLRIDISWERNQLKLWGKGNKERIVSFGKVARHYMTEYDRLCPHKHENFFVTLHGEPLTKNSVKLFMQKLASQLPFELSSHKLRHNFATNYCINQLRANKQVDIYSLMILMGHENVETTESYLHFARQIIASENAISHLDNLFLQP